MAFAFVVVWGFSYLSFLFIWSQVPEKEQVISPDSEEQETISISPRWVIFFPLLLLSLAFVVVGIFSSAPGPALIAGFPATLFFGLIVVFYERIEALVDKHNDCFPT